MGKGWEQRSGERATFDSKQARIGSKQRARAKVLANCIDFVVSNTNTPFENLFVPIWLRSRTGLASMEGEEHGEVIPLRENVYCTDLIVAVLKKWVLPAS